MKISKKILLLTLLLVPVIILADTGIGELLPGILIVPAFVSIHMTVFVLTPLAQIFSGPEEYKTTVKILFIVRLVILFLLIMSVGSQAVMIDFIAVFLGAFIVVPVLSAIKNLKLR